MTSSNLLAKQMVETVTLVNEDVAQMGCVWDVVRHLRSNAGSKENHNGWGWAWRSSLHNDMMFKSFKKKLLVCNYCNSNTVFSHIDK